MIGSDGGVQGRARAGLLREVGDHCGPHLSVSAAAGAVTDSGVAALTGWAGFSAWTEWLVAALLLFIF
jgi:hypothetical protein